MRAILKAHAVQAFRVKGIEPLSQDSDHLFAPEQGVLLVLDGAAPQGWVIGNGEPMPQVGDWFVEDSVGTKKYVAPAAKVTELFEV